MDDTQKNPTTNSPTPPTPIPTIPDTSTVDIKSTKPSFHPYFQKLFVPFLAVLTLVVGLGVSLRLVGQRQNPETQASADMVDLVLSAPTTITPDQEVAVTVGINTQVYKVTAVQLELTYPADKYDYVSLVPANFLTTVLTAASDTNGVAAIIVGSGTTPKEGVGTLAVLTLRSKPSASGATQITTGGGTAIAGIDSAGTAVPSSILGDANPITITISAGNEASPTPSPSPDATATPSPSPSSSPSGSTTPTPSPSPTSSATPTPGPGQPNSCGGSCGSHANCKAGLFCTGGICRNPSCSSDTDCICSAATPTPTPKTTPKPTTKASPSTSPTTQPQITPAPTYEPAPLTRPSVPPDLNFTYIEPTPAPRPGLLSTLASFFSNLFKAIFGQR